MPAGIAASRRIPYERLVFKLAFRKPEDEVEGIALVFVDIHPGSRLQVVGIEVRERSVSGEGGNVKIEVPSSRVGVAVRLNALYQADHLVNMVGGLAHDRGPENVEAVNIVKKCLGIEFGDFQYRLSLFTCLVHHLVFAVVVVAGEMADVGHIHDMGYFVAEESQ